MTFAIATLAQEIAGKPAALHIVRTDDIDRTRAGDGAADACTTGIPASAQASTNSGGRVEEETITPSTLYFSNISMATSVRAPPDRLASSGRRPRSRAS